MKGVGKNESIENAIGSFEWDICALWNKPPGRRLDQHISTERQRWDRHTESISGAAAHPYEGPIFIEVENSPVSQIRLEGKD